MSALTGFLSPFAINLALTPSSRPPMTIVLFEVSDDTCFCSLDIANDAEPPTDATPLSYSAFNAAWIWDDETEDELVAVA